MFVCLLDRAILGGIERGHRCIPGERCRHSSDKNHVKVCGCHYTISREPVNKGHGDDTARQMSKEGPEPLTERPKIPTLTTTG
jgi:hypothetical protein